MKLSKALVLCLLMLPVVALAGENDGITLWGATADDADTLLMGRIGYASEYSFELGAVAKWIDNGPKWGPTPNLYGMYALYHIDEDVIVTDEEPDNEWEQLLHALVGRPYFGLELLYNDTTERIRPAYVIGTLFSSKDDEKQSLSFVVEYLTGNRDDNIIKDVILLGMRIKF